MNLENLAQNLAIVPTTDGFLQYTVLLQKAELALNNFISTGLSGKQISCFRIVASFSAALNVAYDIYKDNSVICDFSFQIEKQKLLQSIQNVQLNLLNDNVIQKLNDEATPSTNIAELVISVAKIASNSDKIDLKSGFQAWKFVSKILSIFHSQLEIEFMQDLEVIAFDKSSRCDQLLESMLSSTKQLFAASLSEAQNDTSKTSEDPHWRTKLKLAAFICRLIVGCIRQFSVALFASTGEGPNRSIIKYLNWALEIQFAGGLFPQGTGLPESFNKEVETSLFVATHVALSCVAQMEPSYNQYVSAAAEVISESNTPPLLKFRIFIGILQDLAKQCDENSFSPWMNDKFNIYNHLFKSLEDGLNYWKPYDKSPNLSDFDVPKFLQLSYDSVTLSTLVDDFLTNVSIQLCQTIRTLPKESFPYLENALLSTVLHSTPIISLVAQDVWCFISRYGNADLCWQYAVLLSNTIICLAERYEVECGTKPLRAPLEQLTRLGNLLSRLIVFLTARQQREYLTNFPLFDELSHGATDKSLVWRFLTIRLSQFQSAIRALIERQLLERTNFLLSQPQSATWMIDTLVCLQLVQDLPVTTLASNSSPLSQLVSTALTSEINCSSSTCLIAPPHIIHLIDVPARTEAIVACLAAWFPRLLQFATTPSLGKDSDVIDESRQLIQLLFTELKSSCAVNGLSYLSMNALARWILAAARSEEDESSSLSSSSPKNSLVRTPVPLFTLVSRSSPLKPLTSSVKWLSDLWSPLAQTARILPSSLTGLVATELKKKLLELSPGIDKAGKSSMSCLVDECLSSLSTIILRLEENISSEHFTSEQSSRGSELGDRLATLFCTFD